MPPGVSAMMSVGLIHASTLGVLTEPAIPTTVIDRPGPGGGAPGPDPGRGRPEPGVSFPLGDAYNDTVSPTPLSSRRAVSWARTTSPATRHQRPADTVTRSIVDPGSGRPEKLAPSISPPFGWASTPWVTGHGPAPDVTPGAASVAASCATSSRPS